jgi:hypothetical protein
LSGLPRDFALCGQHPEYDMQLGVARVYAGSGGAAPLILDLDSGRYRESTLRDLYDAARLVDSLDNIHFFSRSMVARDMPDNRTLDINTAYACLAGTRKHVFVAATEAAHVEEIANMCYAIAGSREAFLARPFLSMNCNMSVPPLRFDAESCEIGAEAVRCGIPLHSNTFGQMGASSPVTMAGTIAQKVCPEAEETAKRAALLSKADLVSQMVFEFPELQGIMGGYYAEYWKETPEVAQAIKEHYKPAFAGDAVPSTPAGAVVAVADKLDTIVGCIGVGLIPSGSEDPYALRRHALGIIQILIHYDYGIALWWLIDQGIEALGDKAKLPQDEIRRHCKDLFAQRFKTLLSAEGFEYDVIDAVLETEIVSLKDTKEKAAALADLKNRDYFEDLATAFKRVARIIEVDVPGEVNQELLKEEEELALFRRFAGIKSTVERHTQAGEYSAALAKIAVIKSEVDDFFDHVMVNVDDAALKANRMALLKSIADLFSPLADFSKIVLKKTEKK